MIVQTNAIFDLSNLAYFNDIEDQSPMEKGPRSNTRAAVDS